MSSQCCCAVSRLCAKAKTSGCCVPCHALLPVQYWTSDPAVCTRSMQLDGCRALRPQAAPVLSICTETTVPYLLEQQAQHALRVARPLPQAVCAAAREEGHGARGSFRAGACSRRGAASVLPVPGGPHSNTPLQSCCSLGSHAAPCCAMPCFCLQPCVHSASLVQCVTQQQLPWHVVHGTSSGQADPQHVQHVQIRAPGRLHVQGAEQIWVQQGQQDHLLQLPHRLAAAADRLPALEGRCASLAPACAPAQEFAERTGPTAAQQQPAVVNRRTSGLAPTCTPAQGSESGQLEPKFTPTGSQPPTGACQPRARLQSSVVRSMQAPADAAFRCARSWLTASAGPGPVRWAPGRGCVQAASHRPCTAAAAVRSGRALPTVLQASVLALSRPPTLRTAAGPGRAPPLHKTWPKEPDTPELSFSRPWTLDPRPWTLSLTFRLCGWGRAKLPGVQRLPVPGQPPVLLPVEGLLVV